MRAVWTFVGPILFCITSPLLANVAAPHYSVVDSQGPEFVGPVNLGEKVRVLKEDLSIDCSQNNECSFEAIYYFRSKKDVTIHAGFIGGDSIEADIDGTPVTVELTKQQSEALNSTGLVEACHYDMEEMPLTGIKIDLKAKSTTKLRVKGELQVIESAWRVPDYSYSSARGRHFMFYYGQGVKEMSFCYDVWPIKTWGGNPKITLKVNLPESDKRTLVLKGITRESSLPIGSEKKFKPNLANTIRGTWETPNPHWLVAHGPSWGLGYNKDRKSGVTQLGYEIMPLSFLGIIGGVDYVVGTKESAPFLITEVATPGILFIPQLGGGIGQSWGESSALRMNAHIGFGPVIIGKQWDRPTEENQPGSSMWYLQFRY